MSQDIKPLAREFLEAIFTDHDVDAVDRLLAPDFVDHNPWEEMIPNVIPASSRRRSTTDVIGHGEVGVSVNTQAQREALVLAGLVAAVAEHAIVSEGRYVVLRELKGGCGPVSVRIVAWGGLRRS
jgi:N-acyl-D-aspartate/D-glutamate deacylase